MSSILTLAILRDCQEKSQVFSKNARINVIKEKMQVADVDERQ
jgi:hypothetical protein